MAAKRTKKALELDQKPPLGSHPTDYKPTSLARRLVLEMAARDIPIKHIGLALTPPVSDMMVVRNFRSELAVGRSMFECRIYNALSDFAEGRPAEYDSKGRLIRSELKPNLTMALYLHKQVFCMRQAGADRFLKSFNLEILDVEELEQLRAILQKAVDNATTSNKQP